jgi:hypothetical protein
MKRKSTPEASQKNLQSAQPYLICRVDFLEDGRTADVMPYVSHEVVDEGYDADSSPLGRPVYWRIVKRDDRKSYLSTFLMSRAEVIKSWGTKGLAHCDPLTGMAAVRIETSLRNE